jgi:hypothetical protein
MPPNQDNQDTQIIGYAEPWIVSPGDPVDIKVGYLHPYPGTSHTLTHFRFQVPKKDTITA